MTNPGGPETPPTGAGSVLCFQLLFNSEGELGYYEHFLKEKENRINASSRSLHGKQSGAPPAHRAPSQMEGPFCLLRDNCHRAQSLGAKPFQL